MTTTTIATLRELAARFRDDERNLTLYFADLETAPPKDSLNRVFGPPVGLTDEQWPTFPELAELLTQTGSLHCWDPRDARMEHVFTVDLRGVALLGVPKDAVAMMLFLSNAGFHRACRDGNPHTAVRFLRERDLHRGVYQGALPRRSLQRWSRRFSLVPIDVPGDVFDVPELGLPVDDPLVELYDAIARAPARLGGCPIGAHEPAAPLRWVESSPTLPWAARAGQGHTLAYDGSYGLESSRTLAYDPGRHLESSHTLAYDPNGLFESSRTLVYDDGDPASALTFGHRARMAARPDSRASSHSGAPHASSPFLMQFQRRFADVNLGQRGVMYVSDRSAYVPS